MVPRSVPYSIIAMSEISFPVTCALGHPIQTLNGYDDLATHHASAHEAIPISDYTAQLRSSTGGALDAPAPPPPAVLSNPLASWGLNRSSFTPYTPADVSSGSELSAQQIRDFLIHYGKNQDPAFTIDVAAFILEFFLYVLYNAATNDATPTGGFTLREQAGSRTLYVKWSAFFAAARDYFDPMGYVFTPRRAMRTCDPLFWVLWNDREIKALDRVRTEGTPLSRQWRLSNGKHPQAYVVVPQLFTVHLTDEEHLCRKKHQYTITKLSGSTSTIDYDGLDPDNTVVASDLERQSYELRGEQLRSAQNAARTRGGVGSSSAPKSDPILDQLYPHFRSSQH
jgi:hypothetical protein